MLKRVSVLACLLAILLMSACAAAPGQGTGLRVERAWARPALASPGAAPSSPAHDGMRDTAAEGTSSAAYFTIVNDSGSADALVGVTSDVAAQAEMHETRIVSGVATMAPVLSVTIPAHGRIAFEPGGLHLMLSGLSRDLKAGDSIRLRLEFAKIGTIEVDAPIKEVE